MNALLKRKVQPYSLIDYHFSSLDAPLVASNSFERGLTAESGFTVFKTYGLHKNDLFVEKKLAVYRIKSMEHGAYADILADGNGGCNILMVHIWPARSFWNCRRFVGRLISLLFKADSSLQYIHASAMSNDKVASKRRTSNQLLTLWVLCGFKKLNSGYDLVFIRQDAR